MTRYTSVYMLKHNYMYDAIVSTNVHNIYIQVNTLCWIYK